MLITFCFVASIICPDSWAGSINRIMQRYDISNGCDRNISGNLVATINVNV